MVAQIARIEQMIEKGYDLTEAEELLRQMETIIEQWHARRRLMLDALAQP
jgi:aconitase B